MFMKLMLKQQQQNFSISKIEHGDHLLLPDIKLATSLPTSFFARFSAFSAIKSFFLHDQKVNTII